MLAEPGQRQGGFALQPDARPGGLQGCDQVRIRFPQRVQEDPVRAEFGDHRHQFGRVRVAPPGPGVPGVVVHEHRHPGVLQRPDQLRQPRHVAVEVPLVAIVDTDHGIGVPQQDAVEPAEPPIRVREQPLGGEARAGEVVEQLVPQPDLGNRKAGLRPPPLRLLVRRCPDRIPVSDPGPPLVEHGPPPRPIGRILGRRDDLRGVHRRPVRRVEVDHDRPVVGPRHQGIHSGGFIRAR